VRRDLDKDEGRTIGTDAPRIKLYDPSGKEFKLDGKPFFVWDACLACDEETIVDVSGECALDMGPSAGEAALHPFWSHAPPPFPSPRSRSALRTSLFPVPAHPQPEQ
jgi:hypothetical protein